MTAKILLRAVVFALPALLLLPAQASAASSCSAIDPPRNAAHPTHNQQLLIPSHGVGLNAFSPLPARARTRP